MFMSKKGQERLAAVVRGSTPTEGVPVDVSFSAFSHALKGVQRGLEGLTRSAQDVASANTRDPGLSELSAALVASLESAAQIEASAAVIKQVDEMLGTLIDTRA